MRRLLLALLALCVVSSAFAQLAALHAGKGAPGGGGGYVGIGDLAGQPTIKAYWSASHCYKSSYTGNIVDASLTSTGALVATIGCTSGGVLAVTAAGSQSTIAGVISACGASTTTCVATVIYDQSGANFCTGAAPCNATTAYTAAPYFVVANGTSTCGATSAYLNSGTFCYSFAAGHYAQTIAEAAAQAQPVNYSCLNMATSYSSTEAVLAEDTNPVGLYWIGSTTLQAYSGGAGLTATSALNTWEGTFAAYSGASSLLQVNNGTATTGTNGSNGFGTAGFSLGNQGGSDVMTGLIAECVVMTGSTITTTNTAAILANWASYWGGGIP